MASKAEQARKAAERSDALEYLRGYLVPGDTVYTILRHVSASGMSRATGFYVMSADRARVYPYDVTHLASKILGSPIHAKHYGVVVGGCGMDMGYHGVYSLSRALWPDGHPCTGHDRDSSSGLRCPSNDHNNGDREYVAGRIHADGGYALNHRWL